MTLYREKIAYFNAKYLLVLKIFCKFARKISGMDLFSYLVVVGISSSM